MNCPVCQQELTSRDRQPIGNTMLLECPSPNKDHGYSCYVSGNEITIFNIIIDQWGISFTHFRWIINTFNDGNAIEHRPLAQVREKITPQQGYQLLLKYMKLKAFA